jgi:hypothetical protein
MLAAADTRGADSGTAYFSSTRRGQNTPDTGSAASRRRAMSWLSARFHTMNPRFVTEGRYAPGLTCFAWVTGLGASRHRNELMLLIVTTEYAEWATGNVCALRLSVNLLRTEWFRRTPAAEEQTNGGAGG